MKLLRLAFQLSYTRYRITVKNLEDSDSQKEQEEFENLLDKAGKEAEKNGITPDALENILGKEIKHIL